MIMRSIKHSGQVVTIELDMIAGRIPQTLNGFKDQSQILSIGEPDLETPGKGPLPIIDHRHGKDVKVTTETPIIQTVLVILQIKAGWILLRMT